MNSNNDDNKDELFGEFIGAQNITPPDISNQPIANLSSLNKAINNLLIDNNLLYRKIIDLENEIKSLKAIIININYPQQIYYPQNQIPMLHPHEQMPQQGQMPQLWQNQSI